MIQLEFLYTLGAGLLGGGIAWGGVVATIKGVKESQTEVKADLKAHIGADLLVQKELLQAVARIEGMLTEVLPK